MPQQPPGTLMCGNASTPARIGGPLVLNGPSQIRGSRGGIGGAHVLEVTALWLQTMVALSREFQARAAAELAQLPEGSMIAEMLADCAVIREQVRACSAR